MIIFLDIDGVMVPAKSWKRPELMDDNFPAFSFRAVAALTFLLRRGATILLTTSHKSSFSIDEWKSIFAKRGLPFHTIQLLPPNTFCISRKDEILQWFSANAIPDDFIIIDDDTSLNDLPGFLKNKLVLTSPYIGLTDEHLAGMRNALQ